MQGRGTVQQHRVSFQNVLQDIPNDWIFTINDLLGGLHRLDDPAFDQFPDDKWFVQFGCHILGQSAFMQFQFGSDHNNRPG